MFGWIRICKKCNNKVNKSNIKGYSYQCLTCDEDLYTFETIKIKYKKYKILDNIK